MKTHKTIPVAMTDADLDELRRRASDARTTLAAWVRRRLGLPAARRAGRPVKAKGETR